MSLKLSLVAARTYDELKRRPGATLRVSDARDPAALDAVTRRLLELVGAYKIGSDQDRGGTYLFWSEVLQEIQAGTFDDLLDRL